MSGMQALYLLLSSIAACLLSNHFDEFGGKINVKKSKRVLFDSLTVIDIRKNFKI